MMDLTVHGMAIMQLASDVRLARLQETLIDPWQRRMIEEMARIARTPTLSNIDALCAEAVQRVHINALRRLAEGVARMDGATTRRSAGQYWRHFKEKEGYGTHAGAALSPQGGGV